MSIVEPPRVIRLPLNPESCESESTTRLAYQPLKLAKDMSYRVFNDAPIMALKKARGLRPLPPEKSIKKSILKDLFISKEKGSKCDFLIVVAMYNESSEQFTHTLEGVAENLEYFKAAKIDPARIACVVIVDGIKPFLQTYNKQKPFFSQFFDEEQIKKRFNVDDLNFCSFPNQQDHDEFAHVFTQEVILGNAHYPLKLIMCVKQFNKRKLNSHLWFFGGFCEMIQPRYVMLLDVGTRPLEGSLFYLYEALDSDKNLAGCCGEIKPMNYDLWKIVVPAQLVEYKFSHILDKALESCIGYITVLPGAFSAYKWEALQGEPLWEDYFKSICHPELMDAFQSNIYLAEDRVLCLSLVSKKDNKYKLRYVKKSAAETDVPDTISVLLAQRRRWINGSWFALVDSVRRFKNIFRSDHNLLRKCCFSLQMSYYIISVIYTWFIVGGFCLALAIALKNNDSNEKSWVDDVLILLYVSVIIIIFITSLGVKPRRVEDFYKGLSFILGCYQIYILYLVLDFCLTQLNSSKGSSDDRKNVAVTLGSTFGLLAFIILINCEVVTISKGIFHYIFLVPTYVNIFFIYSICNVHDCTWGNRPDSLTAEERERLEEFEEFRTRWAILWALCNSGFAYVINQLDSAGSSASYYFLTGISLAGVATIILRVFGGFLYLFHECCRRSIELDKSLLRVRTGIVIPDSSMSFSEDFCREHQNQDLVNEEVDSSRLGLFGDEGNGMERKDQNYSEGVEKGLMEVKSKKEDEGGVIELSKENRKSLRKSKKGFDKEGKKESKRRKSSRRRKEGDVQGDDKTQLDIKNEDEEFKEFDSAPGQIEKNDQKALYSEVENK